MLCCHRKLVFGLRVAIGKASSVLFGYRKDAEPRDMELQEDENSALSSYAAPRSWLEAADRLSPE